MQVRGLNHVALHVEDVPRSAAFYRQVLRLPEMDRPAFDFPGAWFRLGVDQELHLIGDREHPVYSHHRGNHLALQVDELEAWSAHLEECDVERLPTRVRPDGARQIFVRDPDGHWVELCELP